MPPLTHNAIPAQLEHLTKAPRWVGWRYETEGDRQTKVPCGIDGKLVSVHNPAGLVPAPQVVTEAMDGIGLVFLPDQPEKGVDLDACLDDDGSLHAWAQEIVNRLDSYTEISPSGIGLKVFFNGPQVIYDSRSSVKWPSGHKKDHEIAFYAGGYFTVTGRVWLNRPVREVDETTVRWVLDQIKGKRAEKSGRNTSSLLAPKGPYNAAELGECKAGDLPTKLRQLLEYGAPKGTRSEQFHHAVCWLGDLGWTADQIVRRLEQHPDGIAEKYLGRLSTEVKRCLGKRSTPNAEAALPQSPVFNGDISALFRDLALTREDVSKMAEAEFLIPNMIIRGHVAAYVAPANGGKTTIFTYLCERLVKIGMTVLYINADGSPGDLKRHFEHANRHGYAVIAPDAKDGKSTQDVMSRLEVIASTSAHCDEFVFIVDTLKKFTDVIDKRQSKAFFKLMRRITVKGATICLLGHVNKYPGLDGKTIFEGTGDIRNDLDELIYLDVFNNETSKIVEITTRPDKVRAEFAPKSFRIHLDEDRRVSEPDEVIRIVSQDERQLLDAIKTAILDGNHTQKEIVQAVKQLVPHGDKNIRATLIKHCHGDRSEIEVQRTGRGTDLHYTINTDCGFDECVDDLV